MVEFAGAGEGPLDEAVITRLLAELELERGPFYGGLGKANLLARLGGFNSAARFSPWLVMIDLNGDAKCAAEARAKWLAQASPRMCFRIAVRAAESWLLADTERIARFLSISEVRVPEQPELLPDPKLTLIQLARASRSRSTREDLVPRPESGRKVGPAYLSRMIEYVSDQVDGWRPIHAAKRANSLERCLNCLRRVAAVKP